MNRFRKWLIEALGGYTCPIGLEQVQFKVERPKIETCRSVLRVDSFRPVPSDVAEDMVTYRLWSDTVKDYVSVKVEDIPGGALYIAEIEVVVPKKQELHEEAEAAMGGDGANEQLQQESPQDQSTAGQETENS